MTPPAFDAIGLPLCSQCSQSKLERRLRPLRWSFPPNFPYGKLWQSTPDGVNRGEAQSSRTLHRRPDWAIGRGSAAGSLYHHGERAGEGAGQGQVGLGRPRDDDDGPGPRVHIGSARLGREAPASLARGGVRASVLYDARQAANIGVETLLDRAENGMAPPLLLNPTLETTASDGDRLTPQLHHLCLPMLS